MVFGHFEHAEVRVRLWGERSEGNYDEGGLVHGCGWVDSMG